MMVGPDDHSTYHVLLPKEYRDHELFAGRVFCTLPLELLKHLVDECGRGAFNYDILEIEVVLAEQLKHNKHLVGYNATGQAFSYPLLARDGAPHWHATNKTLQKMGMTRQTLDFIQKEAGERLAPFREAQRAYLGWLITNRCFRIERDKLFTRWSTEIEKQGIPQSGPMILKAQRGNKMIRRVRRAKTVQFLTEFQAFYARWHLQRLVTAELPEPVGVQIPIIAPRLLLPHMSAGSVSLYQSSTLPIPGRDRLLSVLEDVRVHGQPAHLAEWVKICQRSRRNNGAFEKFGNVFLLHYYWSQLKRRHPDLFDRRVGRVQVAFARFLDVKPNTVDKYRQTIRRRLQAR